MISFSFYGIYILIFTNGAKRVGSGFDGSEPILIPDVQQ
jgi:hypothetical protein